MPLWTSYLGFLNCKARDVRGLENFARWHSPDGLRYLHYDSSLHEDVAFEPIFVMRGRGNNPIEPPEMVLRLAKEGAITWEGYRDAYLDSLDETSHVWMQNVAEKAFDHAVVLICFEKSPEHCHRRLLAEYIQEHYGVEYKGELG